MAANSEIILFAIQAATRLEGQMKSAQIENIKRHSLHLATPYFEGSVNFKSALRWFEFDKKGQIAAESEPRIFFLIKKANRNIRGITNAERKELKDAYIRIRNIEEGHVKFDNINLSRANIFALMDVQQWKEGENPNPSPLQRVAGSLVEVGVDYFRNYSHLATSNSAQGKLLISFLDAVDEIDFATGKLEEIATSFMTATIETFEANSPFLGGDSNSRQLLKCVTKGILTDVNDYIKTNGSGNLLKQKEAKDWGQLIFKSVLNSAGNEVFANPSQFLKTNAASSEMIAAVGNALLNSILTDINAGDGKVLSLKDIFTAPTLDVISKAAFGVLAQHPEWYEVDNKGLQNMLTALVNTVATYPDQINLDIVPVLTQFILSQMTDNLQLIYGGDPSKPLNNILLKTTNIVLKTLKNAAPATAGEQWKPLFTKAQTLNLVEMTMQEVIANPEWILAKSAAASPLLEDVLASVFQSLQGVSVTQMSTATKMSIVKSAINAVAMNQGLLEKMNLNGTAQQMLNHGIEMTLNLAFGDKATAQTKWALISGNALELLTNAVLIRLAKEGASKNVLMMTEAFLNAELNALTDGQGINLKAIVQKLKSPETLTHLLQYSAQEVTRIAATLLVENPNLVGIKNEEVNNLVQHLATSLTAYPAPFSKAILPDLARIVLENTANNWSTKINANGAGFEGNLLVTASQIVIKALIPEDGQSGFKINFTSDQVLDLVNTAIQQVISKPNWLLTKAGQADPLLATALSVVITTLNGVDVLQLNNEAKIDILRSALTAIGKDKGFMNKVGIEHEFVMSMAINTVMNAAQGRLSGDTTALDLTPEGLTALLTEAAMENIQWALSDNDTLVEMTDAVLSRVLKEGASEATIELVNTLITSEVIKIAKGEPFSLSNLLAKLESPEQLADIIAVFKVI